MGLMDYKAYIINLNTREDRWEQAFLELLDMGIKSINRFPAYTGGLEGYNKSYLSCMKISGVKYIFEDDVMFTEGAKDVLGKALIQLPDDFDMLYLGGNVLEPIQRHSANLYRAYRGVHATHAVLWSERGRDKFLKYYPPEKQEGQLVDNWLYERGQSLMNCYIISPLIAFQRPSYSDVNGAFSDYIEEMEEHEKQNML